MLYVKTNMSLCKKHLFKFGRKSVFLFYRFPNISEAEDDNMM